jgi:Mg2+-importing ATPase
VEAGTGANGDELAGRLNTSERGLSPEEAAARLATYGPNTTRVRHHVALATLGRQLRNPLLGLLIVAAVVSFAVHQRLDAAIILGILVLSVLLGFFDEYRADRSAQLLEGLLTRSARVVRSGRVVRIAAEEVVPGDVLVFETGDVIAADGYLFEAIELACEESILTGESAPAEKRVAGPEGNAGLVFAGTVVSSGQGRAFALATGPRTMVGGIARSIGGARQATEFERGLRRFSLFLVLVTATLTTFMFTANALLGRGLLESLLFALAIAVGLTPQLLPAIVTVSLATGGRRLMERRVIVRNLVAIEDLGNVETLFSDKTGTLTRGSIALDTVGAPGGDEGPVLAWAALWSLREGGNTAGNALDQALADDARVGEAAKARAGWEVEQELPFSYERRYGAIAARSPEGDAWVVVKGAAEEVLQRCTMGRTWGDVWQAEAHARLEEMVSQGLRVLAVGVRKSAGEHLGKAAGRELDLAGFLAFSDPPKQEARAALAELSELGIAVKVLTGDHPEVARHVCEQLGLEVRGVVTGGEIGRMDEEGLREAVAANTVFARVSPEQKRALVKAAQSRGRDVGVIGDGVNDAPALRQADVGISVDSATDVAKAAANVVLLEKDLGVLAAGVREGRRTFANTVKYVLMATSSNFGNMFSAAGASLFLSFLPMRPTQILLNNFLYDISELTLPMDRVDDELTQRPAHWDLRMVGRFMLVFGPASSLYDFLTFGLMLKVFDAGESLFQSGWFVESLCTQTLVIFLLRTRRVPFWHSRPARALVATSLACVAAAVALPYSPLAEPLNFTAPSAGFLAALTGMVLTYIVLVELAKGWFYRTWPGQGPMAAETARLAPAPSGAGSSRSTARRQ